MTNKTARVQLAVAVVLLAATPTWAQLVNYEMVPIGDAGNAAHTSGYGAVNYEYRIGKYEVTIGQYTAFLNAVAKTDAYGLYPMHPNGFPAMEGGVGTGIWNWNAAGIVRNGSNGNYTYAAQGPLGGKPVGADSTDNRPIAFVSWFNAARFANWMSNGQPIGEQGATTTENGAYALNGVTSGAAPSLNAVNPNTGLSPLYRIPTDNEWHKAAFYKGGGINAGYWTYPTQSDATPGNVLGSFPNQVNYVANQLMSVTQGSGWSGFQNYLTNVGAFSSSQSPYGTFDQGGNVSEWTDLDGQSGSSRGLRGINWNNAGAIGDTSSAAVRYFSTDAWAEWAGFRLAAPAVVPEPSTYAMALAGLACGGYSMWRRRKRA